MAQANRRELLTADLKMVWELVTDNGNASWRSNVERIEVHGNGEKFTEYTKGGFSTDFTEEVTAKNPVLKPFVGIYLKKQQKQYVEDLKSFSFMMAPERSMVYADL